MLNLGSISYNMTRHIWPRQVSWNVCRGIYHIGIPPPLLVIGEPTGDVLVGELGLELSLPCKLSTIGFISLHTLPS